LFSLVAQLRAEGMSLDGVRDALPGRLATARDELAQGVARPVDYLPAVAKGQSVALEIWVDIARQLEAVQGALEATENERDYLRGRVTELEDRLNAETAARAAAEAQRDLLAGRPPGFWARVFGRGQKTD
jgi:hypothetical protein